MNDPDLDGLWRDLLDDGTDAAFADLSRTQTLACARRLRRRRKLWRTGIAGVGGCALFYLATRLAAPFPAPDVAGSGTRPLPSAPTETGLPPVHFLTDEELLSRFPQRPVALVGSPEHQQLIFLDDPRLRR